MRVRGIRCALAGAAGKDRTDAAAALTDARKKLADLLASSGRPADALEPHFTCRLCEDTGIVDGRTCSCVHKVMQQLRRREIEGLSSLSISSFDTMELRYYPARLDASLREPIRSYMSTLLDDLRGYADEFDTTSESLMLLGNAGLGKTHAALAIAGEVLEKGFDVIYVSSPDFFSKLEALHFGSDPAGEEEMLLRTAAGADLLILDDLGSEFNSSFLISTLYSLLNMAACQAFEKVGIRGFTADYAYDYTCMETLQGLSVSELSSAAGRKWRTAYSDPANSERVGLDDTVWPGAFERMAQFIQDTHLTADDLGLTYDDVMNLFRNGEVAMYFGSSAGVKMFQEEGIDTTFLPFFGQNGEKWIMTTPYFQIALNRDLEKDSARREKAMKVLNVMLRGGQNHVISDGQDLLSYSQNVSLRLTEYMKDIRPVVEQNHMYIRIASNDFFAVSQDVVSRMIAGKLYGKAGVSELQRPAPHGKDHHGRDGADLREELFQCLPQKRRQRLLLRDGEHAVRRL